MVTDLCQALGSGSSACMCVRLSSSRDGDRFAADEWVSHYLFCTCMSSDAAGYGNDVFWCADQRVFLLFQNVALVLMVL